MASVLGGARWSARDPFQSPQGADGAERINERRAGLIFYEVFTPVDVNSPDDGNVPVMKGEGVLPFATSTRA